MRIDDMMIPGELPKITPRIIGLVGPAGSGKDTVAGFILDILEGERLSLAGPFKEFSGKVFDFTHDQLYGPSSARNGFDPRISYDNAPAWNIDFGKRYRGLFGMVRMALDWLKPERIAPPPRPYSIEEVEDNRHQIWVRYNQNETEFLKDVLPADIDIEFGRVQLRKIMQRIMGERNISPRLVLQLIGSEFGRTISTSIWVDRALRRANEILAKGKSPIITDVRFLNEAEKFHGVGAMLIFIETPVVEELTTGVAGHASEQEMRTPEMRKFMTKVIYNAKDGLDKLRVIVNGVFFDA